MIHEGKHVKFHYTLKVDGKVIESSLEGNPLEYTHGKDPIIPGLQKGLEGHKEGDKCQINVTPEEGYGLIHKDLLVEVSKTKMPEGDIKLGTQLTAKSGTGQNLQGRVKDIRPDTILVDFNHPLAGKNLVFDVEVLAVTAPI